MEQVMFDLSFKRWESLSNGLVVAVEFHFRRHVVEKVGINLNPRKLNIKSIRSFHYKVQVPFYVTAKTEHMFCKPV